MAAGLGSRFGGLKQIEPIDCFGNFIIDYSIFDAVRCGFDKIVFVVKEENLNLFKSTIGSRLENFVKVEYVFQSTDVENNLLNIPQRTKPWGTAHAVLCAKNTVSDSFAVINADDFYGYDSFKKLAYFLKNNKNNCALVGYPAINTLSFGGAVKRGVCEIFNNKLISITESVLKLNTNNTIEAFAIAGDNQQVFSVNKNTLVSMNMFGFSRFFIDFLEDKFHKFLIENQNNLCDCEFFLPTVVSSFVKEKQTNVEILKTTSKWFGITYKEDKLIVQKEIENCVKSNIYPKNLWNV